MEYRMKTEVDVHDVDFNGVCRASSLMKYIQSTAQLQLTENGDIAEAELIRDMINADGLVYIDGEEMQTQVNAYCDFLAKKGVEITAPQF